MSSAAGAGSAGNQGAAEHADLSDALMLGTLERLLAIDAIELHEALDRATQLVAEALEADKVDVFLLESASMTLVARGTSDTPMGQREKAIGLDRLPLANGGRTVEVFQTGAPYLTGHADLDERELVGLKQALGIRSAMMVPLPLRSEGRGVLVVASAASERFTQGDMQFLEAISGWIGLVAHRAELVERIAQEAHEKGRRRGAEDLISIVAHDLRNYLTPLKGRLFLLQRRAERQQRQVDLQDARIAVQEVNRLEQMIGSLLDATRLDQGLFVLNRQAVDVVKLASETAEALATPRNAIQVRGPDVALALVDPHRVRQALENLLVNALRFSPEKAPVRVEITMLSAPTAYSAADQAVGDQSETEESLVIAVQDQGPGIASEALPSLVARFSAGPNSTGVGLGLYLANQIAIAHGGKLSVESRPTEGARFQLTLPLALPQEPAEPADDAPSGQVTTGEQAPGRPGAGPDSEQ
jgi:signal transduction histidine kinase